MTEPRLRLLIERGGLVSVVSPDLPELRLDVPNFWRHGTHHMDRLGPAMDLAREMAKTIIEERGRHRRV